MNEDTPFDAWEVETVDLTARVAAGIGAVPPPVERPSFEQDLLEELRALRREIADLRGTTALLQDEVARLRLGSSVRRIVPFGPAEGLVRLS
jgi:hypothetical protein